MPNENWVEVDANGNPINKQPQTQSRGGGFDIFGAITKTANKAETPIDNSKWVEVDENGNPISQTPQPNQTFLGVPKEQLRQYYNQQVQKQQAQQPLQVQPQIGVNPTAQQPVKPVEIKGEIPKELQYKMVDDNGINANRVIENLSKGGNYEMSNKVIEELPSKNAYAADLMGYNYAQLAKQAFTKGQFKEAKQYSDLAKQNLDDAEKLYETTKTSRPNVNQLRSEINLINGNYLSAYQDADKVSKAHNASFRFAGNMDSEQLAQEKYNAEHKLYAEQIKYNSLVGLQIPIEELAEQKQKVDKLQLQINAVDKELRYKEWLPTLRSPQMTEQLASMMGFPYPSTIRGIVEGVERAASGIDLMAKGATHGKEGEQYGTEEERDAMFKLGALKTLNGTAGMAFGTIMTATPNGAVINLAFNIPNMMGSPEALSPLMQPVSFVREKVVGAEKPKTETSQEAWALADLVGMTILFGALHKVGSGEWKDPKSIENAKNIIDKIETGQELTKLEIEEMYRWVQETPNDVKQKAIDWLAINKRKYDEKLKQQEQLKPEETQPVETKVEPIEEAKPVTETPVEAEVKPVEKAVEPVSEPINEPVNEVKPFDQRTDTEHATYIKDQFRKQFSEKGVPQEQIDGAIALMEARAKASGKGDGWYRGIEDVKSGEFQGENLLYQYIGENAKLGKEILDNLDVAKKMETSKESPEKIKQATGWHRGIDEKWKYETDDSTAKIKIDPLQERDSLIKGEKTKEYKLSEILDDKKLLESVPELKDTTVILTVEGDLEHGSGKINGENYIQINLNKNDAFEHSGFQKILRHELQHTAQSIFRFAKGDNADTIRERMVNEFREKNKRNPSGKEHVEIFNKADREYRLSAGELEARDVENRIQLTKEERKQNMPFKGQDISEAIIKLQRSGDVARGAVETLENGKKVIHALERPDFSTMVHEIAYIFEGDLTKAESKTVTDWAGTKEWNTKTSEKWSRGFERYLRDGKAPTAELKTLFEKFKTWLTDIYKTLKGSEIENKVSPEVKKIFDRLLTEQEKAKPTEPTSKSVLKQYADNQEQLYKDHIEKTLQDKRIEIGNDKELVTQEVLNEMSKNPDKPISENVEKGVDNYVEQFGEKPTTDALKDVESTAKALDGSSLKGIVFADKNGVEKIVVQDNKGGGFLIKNNDGKPQNPTMGNHKDISEAYHKAKADGSNPELVNAVESLLSKEQTPQAEAKDGVGSGVGGDVDATTKALEGLSIDESSEIARLVSKNEIKIKSTNVKDVEKLLNQKGNPKKGDILNIGGTDWEVNKINKRQIWDSTKKEFKDADGYEIQIRNSKNGETYTIRTDNNNSFKGSELSVREKLSNYEKQIAEAYHKAKLDGSNPELVKAVEDLLGKKETTKPTVAETPTVEAPKKPTRKEKLQQKQEKINKLDEEISDLWGMLGNVKKAVGEGKNKYKTDLDVIMALAKKYVERFGLTLEQAIDRIRKEAPDEYKKVIDENKGEILSKKEIGLTHEETAKMREELGLPEMEKQVVHDTDLIRQADERIKKGESIDKLANDIINGKKAGNPVDYVMLSKAAAEIDSRLSDPKISEKEFNELFNKQKKLIEAAEKTGSLHGSGLGVRSRIKAVQEDSISDFLMSATERNKGAELTEEQIKQERKEFEELKKSKEDLEKELERLKADAVKKAAKQELDNLKSEAKKQRRSVKKEKLDDEFDDLSKEFSKIVMGQLHAGINPELVGIVAKMAKNRVEKGIVNLADVVDNIHDSIKGYLTKEQIEEIIAGEHNEKKATRNELQKQKYELQQEARAATKLRRLQEGEQPKTEQKKRQQNQRIFELQKQIKEHDLTKLAQYEARMQRQIDKLQDKLDKGEFMKEPPKVKVKLTPQARELTNKYIRLKQERDIRIMREEYNNRKAVEKVRDIVIRVLNTPRTIMASMDYSAPLRQGVIAMAAHPIIGGKAFGKMFKFSVSEKEFDRWFYELKGDPLYPIAKESKLYIADPMDLTLNAKEEMFGGSYAEQIPGLKIPIKASERAYVGFLNKVRWDLFKNMVDRFESQGKTYDNSPELYKAAADYINTMTGRGRLGKLENSAATLNSVLFAPRLIASRIKMLTNFMNPSFYMKTPKEVRVEYFKDMGKFIGLGMTVLALAKLGGAEVEYDPRSTDFGKIKIGNSRWDIWGGFGQYIRVITQLLTGQSKSTQTGIIRELNGEDVFGQTRGDVAIRFARGKLAPVPSMVADFMTGRKVTGEEISAKNEVLDMIVPLIYSDIKDAYKDKGVSALFSIGIPAMFGVGVQTFDNRDYVQKIMDKRKNPKPPITEEEKLQHKMERATNEQHIKEQAEKYGIEYVPPKKAKGGTPNKPHKNLNKNITKKLR